MVVVVDLGEAEAPADLQEGALRRNELVSAPAADRDRATPAVELVGALRIVFQATKVRQHLRPAPGIVAQRRPLVVIGRHAAQGNRGVDRGGSADHPAAGIRDDPAGSGLGGQSPVVLAQRHPPGVLKIVRGQLEGREVGTRLQQEDAAGRLLRRASREDRTSRTAPHDDVVVLHASGLVVRYSSKNGSPSRAYSRATSRLSSTPSPGPSGTRMRPLSITLPSQPVARSSQNGTLMPCHSRARKFGTAAATCTAATVPIGLAMQCGATEM